VDGLKGEFEVFWKQYGKRPGGNPKKGAYRAYASRRKEGVTAEELLQGAMKYAAYWDKKPAHEKRFKKQTRFWLSPDYEGWAQDWSVQDDSVTGSNVDVLRSALEALRDE
jgi:hypothetical protein